MEGFFMKRVSSPSTLLLAMASLSTVKSAPVLSNDTLDSAYQDKLAELLKTGRNEDFKFTCSYC